MALLRSNAKICPIFLKLRLAFGLIEVQHEKVIQSFWDWDRLLALLRSNVNNSSNLIEIEIDSWPSWGLTWKFVQSFWDWDRLLALLRSNVKICLILLRLRLAYGFIELQREKFIQSFWDWDRLLTLLRSNMKKNYPILFRLRSKIGPYWCPMWKNLSNFIEIEIGIFGTLLGSNVKILLSNLIQIEIDIFWTLLRSNVKKFIQSFWDWDRPLALLGSNVNNSSNLIEIEIDSWPSWGLTSKFAQSYWDWDRLLALLRSNVKICLILLRLRLNFWLIEVQREKFIQSFWDWDRLLTLLRPNMKKTIQSYSD